MARAALNRASAIFRFWLAGIRSSSAWSSGSSKISHHRPRGRESLGCATFQPSASDRKSTRLNSSHVAISYAVFCLKKKINTDETLWEDLIDTNYTSVLS